MVQRDLLELLRAALADAAETLGFEGPLPEVELETPKSKEHGDLTTNVALRLASRAGRPAREVAEVIASRVPPHEWVRSIEVAGPGFINFRLADRWLHDVLRSVIQAGSRFGWTEPKGRRAQVEYVSANPTGPLHIGHARNAAIGDAIANVLEAAGWSIEREYYWNDTGRQMELFGASVEARYFQLLGRDAEVPDDGYLGEYLVEVAKEIVNEVGESVADLPSEERRARLLHEGAERVLASIRDSLERFGVRFDAFFSERQLHDSGEIDEAVARLRAAGHAYDHEGAVWFRSTTFGDDKDRPLVRSNGAPTYFAADCAYLIDKFSRGFGHLVYVWGADHHGGVVRVRGAATALGYDPAAVEMVLYQWVTLMRAGREVGMSKRAGAFVTLDELIDEVGADATKFTLLSRSSDSPLSFDIEEVRRRSLDNPVYYVQYGHARIASILRKAEAEGIDLGEVEGTELSLLTHEAELDLLRAISEVPAEIERAAELRAPHRLTHVSQDLAARFHRFYTECRVVSDDRALTRARLWLCVATKQVIANLLGLLGVSAPERMEREDDGTGY
jgi:arginyl-tRNA synthetase